MQCINGLATLSCDHNRGLSLCVNGRMIIEGNENQPLWTILLQMPSTPSRAGKRRMLDSLSCTAREEELPDGFALEYEQLGEEAPFSGISLRLEFHREGEGFSGEATVRNDSAPWIVREFAGPFLYGIDTSTADLLWPNGLGQRFRDCAGFEKRSMAYPSGLLTMPWFALAGEQRGLYLGSHDPAGGMRHFDLKHDQQTRRATFGMNHYPFCAPGGSWQMPAAIIYPYSGEWHAAAQIYRAWFDQHGKPLVQPDWVRDISGWLLAILKQQNGDVMWDYRTGIDRLCDICQERGLNTLGLFGWAHGGHDYLYPEFIPDNLMGGRQALKDALARARQRGIRTILYAQGMIMDASSDFYRYQGNDVISLQENSEPHLSSIRKFNSSTPVPFAMACSGAERWRKKLIETARQAHELGADGILFDQAGVFLPSLCFSTSHHHATPATAFAEERQALMLAVTEHMRDISPEFIVMTEGVFDTLLRTLHACHGWGFGAISYPGHWPDENDDPATAFPALFRYTFPELVMTHRYPQPALDRENGNYACVYGLRLELETRYRADVSYLTEGRPPVAEDYADTSYWPPFANLVQKAIAEGEKNYMPKLLAFCKRNATFLWRGRFQDTQGFSCVGAGLVAKAYRDDIGRLGVIVWNPTAEPVACELVTPGMTLQAVDSPESSVMAATAIAPSSLRLYVFA